VDKGGPDLRGAVSHRRVASAPTEGTTGSSLVRCAPARSWPLGTGHSDPRGADDLPASGPSRRGPGGKDVHGLLADMGSTIYVPSSEGPGAVDKEGTRSASALSPARHRHPVPPLETSGACSACQGMNRNRRKRRIAALYSLVCTRSGEPLRVRSQASSVGVWPVTANSLVTIFHVPSILINEKKLT
jgi:hypothetical protein